MAQSNKAQKRAYAEGRSAAGAGKALTANPYTSKTLLRDKWRMGWMDGADDAQRAAFAPGAVTAFERGSLVFADGGDHGA